MAQPLRPKVDKALRLRWGMVGAVLAVAGLVWFAKTGVLKNAQDLQSNPNVKILCPRCGGESDKQTNCSLCRGKGFLWVDKNKYLPGEVTLIP